MSRVTPEAQSPKSFAQRLITPLGDIAELTYDPLDENQRICQTIDCVKRDDAGAIAVFLGTTRDKFQDKIVTRLEYQAYTPLAMKTMSRILTETHTLHAPQSASTSTSTTTLQTSPGTSQKSLLKSVVVHRLGSVPVGQTSIIIAVSSPHRREAFETCEWILERVKKDVQVWKREWYARGKSAVPQKKGVESGDIGLVMGRDSEAGVMGVETETESAWKENS